MYSPTQVEISDDVAVKMLKESVMELTGEQAGFYTSGMIWWGKFLEDFKFYLSTRNHLKDFCECETTVAKEELVFTYKIHTTMMKKYLSMINVMLQLCEYPCSMRYLADQFKNLLYYLKM